MKKAFTLLELMIVIIILGVLVSSGVMQYQASFEKPRGAEARQILGQLRSACATIFMDTGSIANCTPENLHIGTDTDMIPSSCRSTHYFSYTIIVALPNNVVFVANRCTSGGKSPDVSTARNLRLQVNYTTGEDTWTTMAGI